MHLALPVQKSRALFEGKQASGAAPTIPEEKNDAEDFDDHDSLFDESEDDAPLEESAPKSSPAPTAATKPTHRESEGLADDGSERRAQTTGFDGEAGVPEVAPSQRPLALPKARIPVQEAIIPDERIPTPPVSSAPAVDFDPELEKQFEGMVGDLGWDYVPYVPTTDKVVGDNQTSPAATQTTTAPRSPVVPAAAIKSPGASSKAPKRAKGKKRSHEEHLDEEEPVVAGSSRPSKAPKRAKEAAAKVGEVWVGPEPNRVITEDHLKFWRDQERNWIPLAEQIEAREDAKKARKAAYARNRRAQGYGPPVAKAATAPFSSFRQQAMQVVSQRCNFVGKRECVTVGCSEDFAIVLDDDEEDAPHENEDEDEEMEWENLCAPDAPPVVAAKKPGNSGEEDAPQEDESEEEVTARLMAEFASIQTTAPESAAEDHAVGSNAAGSSSELALEKTEGASPVEAASAEPQAEKEKEPSAEAAPQKGLKNASRPKKKATKPTSRALEHLKRLFC